MTYDCKAALEIGVLAKKSSGTDHSKRCVDGESCVRVESMLNV